jgi:hypothetical protein
MCEALGVAEETIPLIYWVQAPSTGKKKDSVQPVTQKLPQTTPINTKYLPGVMCQHLF